MSPEVISIIGVGVAVLTVQIATLGLVWASTRDQNRRIDNQNRRIDDQRMEIVAQIIASEQRLTHRIDRLEDRLVRVEEREETAVT